MTRNTLRAYAFFRPGMPAQSALALARAESARHELEGAGLLRVRWEDDPEPYQLGDAETHYPSEVLGCVLETRQEDDDDCPWEHVASLWGIGDPSLEYARVIEAELCCELPS